MDDLPVTTVVGTAGFVTGLAFGAVALHANFCIMGGLSDALFLRDFRRVRAWLLAVAVAMAGGHLLHGHGMIDLRQSIYLTPSLGWLGAVIGGVAFGFGMVLAGGCGSRNLVRAGAGSLKALVVVLVMGVFAYMTLRGITGAVRVELEAATNADLAALGAGSQGLADLLAAWAGVDAPAVRAALAAFLATALALFSLGDIRFLRTPRLLVAGLAIGALVAAGWAITGIMGADEFEPTSLASLTFVAPVGNALQYLMTFTGATVTFGVGAVGGTLVGSFLMAAATGTLHVEAFRDRGDMVRHLFGAAIMGIGGVMALGCTIGQGITGLSTLSLGSLIAVASIVVGALWGLKAQETGTPWAAQRSLGRRD